MPNFAIFGGTFNPVHWGHLLIAETAFDQFCLDRVIWVPTFHPPHKAQPLVPFEHRLEMVSRAIADHPAFTVSAVDRHQEDTSYAIATLHALQALEPHACWYWIIGNDAFQSLPRWKASQELVAQCFWLVAPREGSRDAEAAGEAEGARENSKSPHTPHRSTERSRRSSTPHPPPPIPHWRPLQMPTVAISSSLIRQRCRTGRSIRYLVPEAVRCYIVEQALYQTS